MGSCQQWAAVAEQHAVPAAQWVLSTLGWRRDALRNQVTGSLAAGDSQPEGHWSPWTLSASPTEQRQHPANCCIPSPPPSPP